METNKNEKPAEEGKMKLATVLLRINKDATVVKSNVTPAQALLLCVIHVRGGGGEPISSIEETGEVERTQPQEIARLRSIYGNSAVRALFGPNSPLPQTFHSALESSQAWVEDSQGLGDSEPIVGRRLTAEENRSFV